MVVWVINTFLIQQSSKKSTWFIPCHISQISETSLPLIFYFVHIFSEDKQTQMLIKALMDVYLIKIPILCRGGSKLWGIKYVKIVAALYANSVSSKK